LNPQSNIPHLDLKPINIRSDPNSRKVYGKRYGASKIQFDLGKSFSKQELTSTGSLLFHIQLVKATRQSIHSLAQPINVQSPSTVSRLLGEENVTIIMSVQNPNSIGAIGWFGCNLFR
jgi:hypothetical protein